MLERNMWRESVANRSRRPGAGVPTSDEADRVDLMPRRTYKLKPDIRTNELPIRYHAFENLGKVVQIDDSRLITPGADVLMVHTERYTLTVYAYQDRDFIFENYDASTSHAVSSGRVPWERAESLLYQALVDWRSKGK